MRNTLCDSARAVPRWPCGRSYAPGGSLSLSFYAPHRLPALTSVVEVPYAVSMGEVANAMLVRYGAAMNEVTVPMAPREVLPLPAHSPRLVGSRLAAAQIERIPACDCCLLIEPADRAGAIDDGAVASIQQDRLWRSAFFFLVRLAEARRVVVMRSEGRPADVDTVGLVEIVPTTGLALQAAEDGRGSPSPTTVAQCLRSQRLPSAGGVGWWLSNLQLLDDETSLALLRLLDARAHRDVLDGGRGLFLLSFSPDDHHRRIGFWHLLWRHGHGHSKSGVVIPSWSPLRLHQPGRGLRFWSHSVVATPRGGPRRERCSADDLARWCGGAAGGNHRPSPIMWLVTHPWDRRRVMDALLDDDLLADDLRRVRRLDDGTPLVPGVRVRCRCDDTAGRTGGGRAGEVLVVRSCTSTVRLVALDDQRPCHIGHGPLRRFHQHADVALLSARLGGIYLQRPVVVVHHDHDPPPEWMDTELVRLGEDVTLLWVVPTGGSRRRRTGSICSSSDRRRRPSSQRVEEDPEAPVRTATVWMQLCAALAFDTDEEEK